MSFLKTLLGAATPIGEIAEGVEAVAKVAEKGEELVHDNNVEVAGENKITGADSAASAQVNADVAQAAVATDPTAALALLRDGDA